MNDFLIELGKNPNARKFIQSLGLPIPMPQELKRSEGPGVERPLENSNVAVCSTTDSVISEKLAHILTMAGANPYVWGDEGLLDVFRGPGEAFARPARALQLEESFLADTKLKALILDATQICTTADLQRLYDFFHPLVRSLSRCGRVVVIGRPPAAQTTVEAAAAQAALEGFVRSVAKEIGKKGSTAQLLYLREGSEDKLAGPLRFILSSRSAYISGQPIYVNNVASPSTSEPLWVTPLSGKVALVTGAARGIGAATARLLASEGATVVCLDRPGDEAAVSQLARDIGGTVLLADVTAEDAPKQISDSLREEHGGVDIVVHNAGITRDKTLARMPVELWNQTIDVNLGAVARITETLLDEGVLRDYGRLIFLSSIAGIAGNMGQTNYAASKSGVIGLVRHLGNSIATRGITANAIAPGFIETRLTAAIPFAIREIARRMNSLGQGGKPEDVAQAINFLASPSSQGMTGQIIRVCGGSLVGA